MRWSWESQKMIFVIYVTFFSRHLPIPNKICSPRVLVGTKNTQLMHQPCGSILSRALDYSDPLCGETALLQNHICNRPYIVARAQCVSWVMGTQGHWQMYRFQKNSKIKVTTKISLVIWHRNLPIVFSLRGVTTNLILMKERDTNSTGWG